MDLSNRLHNSNASSVYNYALSGTLPLLTAHGDVSLSYSAEPSTLVYCC